MVELVTGWIECGSFPELSQVYGLAESEWVILIAKA